MADSTVAATLRSGSWRAITGYQWLVFAVVWLGWTLDAADFGLFSLVLQPALRNLLGFASTGVLPPEQMAQIGKYGGLLIMTGLLGWAAGGFIFGILADYIGRVRALMFSIALYSLFTAMQGLSVGLFDLGLYRFLAGIGTGAEIIVGIPLLAEAHDCQRRQGVHTLRPDPAVQPTEPVQHVRWPAVRARLADGDLDHGKLVADDPPATGGKDRDGQSWRG